jgi:AcrR family transcriptional regulator
MMPRVPVATWREALLLAGSPGGEASGSAAAELRFRVMDAAEAGTRGGGERRPAAYRRTAGSARGEARRRELLDLVVEDLAVHGLVDFSLRRAARAAGTTHKVLLYYFDGVDGLLEQALFRLRERRIHSALAVASQGPRSRPLAERIRAIWPVLKSDELGLRVIDQAIGLVMYDPERYARLGTQAVAQYLPTLLSLCPDGWSDQRKLEVAHLLLAVFRGFLMEWRTAGNAVGIDAGMAALVRALEREEAAGP